MRVFGAICLTFLLGVSCRRGERGLDALLPLGEKALVGVSFSVNTEGVGGDGGRAQLAHSANGLSLDPRLSGFPPSYSIANPGVDTDEATSRDYTPRDVWVIQYNGVGDDALLVGLPRYIELSGPANIQAVISSSPNTLVFVANTHDANLEWGDVGTPSKLMLAYKTITKEQDCLGNNLYPVKDLILSGKYVGVIGNGPISVALVRNIVRLDLRLENAASSGLTLGTIQLCNVPGRLHYAAGLLPTDVIFPRQIDYIDYPEQAIEQASAPGSEQLFTFYMPANQMGVNPASTTSGDKSIQAPGHSTHFRITALDAQRQGYLYKIYPGANLINDYNLSANKRYSMELSINAPGDGATDGRVQHYGPVDFPSANSFILNPAPPGAKDRVFTIPIDRVNQFWQGVDPSLTIGPTDTWTVELIWQDTPTADFIRFVDLNDGSLSSTLSGTGPAERIALTTKASYQGNALIGIRKNGSGAQGFLWSWHLWVTDYDPQCRAAPMAGQYVYSTTGGAVHRLEGEAWKVGRYRDKYIMDRHLGARSWRYSQVGALYYQFGRKDPMPFIGSGNVLYDIHGVRLPDDDPRNATTTFKDAGLGVTLATGVLNPTCFYAKEAVNGRGDWCIEGKQGNYQWNGTEDGGDHKSIFDPCPPLWKVPMVDTWLDFRFDPNNAARSTMLSVERDARLRWGYNDMPGGRYWPVGQEVGGVVFYPSLGLRDINGFRMGDVAAFGWIWCAVASGRTAGYVLRIDKGNVYPDTGSHRAYGFAVRCVQE